MSVFEMKSRNKETFSQEMSMSFWNTCFDLDPQEEERGHSVFGDVHRSCFNWPDNPLPFPKGRQDFVCSHFLLSPHFSIMPLCFVSLQGALN